MEKCHLIEVILSCIWHMFVPTNEHDKHDDEDDENLLKIHPLTCRGNSRVWLRKTFAKLH